MSSRDPVRRPCRYAAGVLRSPWQHPYRGRAGLNHSTSMRARQFIPLSGALVFSVNGENIRVLPSISRELLLSNSRLGQPSLVRTSDTRFESAGFKWFSQRVGGRPVNQEVFTLAFVL